MEIEINKQVMLKSRKKACEKINKKFGLNIKVEKREVNNGEIYINNTGDIIE